MRKKKKRKSGGKNTGNGWVAGHERQEDKRNKGRGGVEKEKEERNWK